MKYMGSKKRIVKQILRIMLKERKHNQWWVEPFVGGGNVISGVSGPRMGSDIDFNAIQALIHIRDNIESLPKNNREFTEFKYLEIKENTSDYEYKSYVGFIASYGGRWLNGWARGKDCRGKDRDYILEAYKNAIVQSKKLKGVVLIHTPYQNLNIPPNSIIYCDPPYKGTTEYCKKGFDSDVFWEWCRTKQKQGHSVFISEYDAPNDFECIFRKEITNTLEKETGSKTGIEKLFRLKQRLYKKPIQTSFFTQERDNEFRKN